jgi:hypothetical protein
MEEALGGAVGYQFTVRIAIELSFRGDCLLSE